MSQFWNDWELITEKKGRQYWQYIGDNNQDYLKEIHKGFIFDKSSNANSADKVYRQFATKNSSHFSEAKHESTVEYHLEKGIHFYKQLITDNHFIPGDYGGPHFLLPGLLIVSYITNTPFPQAHQELMKQYMLNHQNKDGGWGLHIEGKSTMIGSCLNYVALRLLGVPIDHTQIAKGRKWIKDNGGATGVPSWGKFYLSALNVYEWDGMNSLFPEIWLLPKWLPFYPAKYWCHARMVYLPMAYAYGAKIKHPLNDLTTSLRQELYLDKYETINWAKARYDCAKSDLFRKPKKLLKLFNGIVNLYEISPFKSVRKKALNFIIDYINAEDKHTQYINIGPVNQAMNSLAIWHKYGKESIQFKNHVERWKDYLWVAEDGMKMQGYNGAQFWETAFTLNAINESSIGLKHKTSNDQLFDFIDTCQIQEGIVEDELFFRHPNEGGWPFSTVEHGWPITDCTADGVKTVIHHENLHQLTNFDVKRLEKAIDLILSFQSEDGGWASYEKRRAPFWIEALNPSELFGEIMVDYSYVECSSSSIQGLFSFQQKYPEYKNEEISKAIKKGIGFIKNQQNNNGSWYGSWGVCYTYAAWFALEALYCNNENYATSESVRKGCDFLVQHQRKDGSWGESYLSCVKERYIEHQDGGQIINTAWAILGMMKVDFPDKAVIQQGIDFIISRQEENGDFPQEGISGVFNKNCMETYTSYRNVFPIWALNRFIGYKKRMSNK